MAHKRFATFEQWLVRDERTGCLNFSGTKVGAGYGRIRAGRKLVLTHRLAYEMAYGEIPDGLNVCHRCDNPACCNPEHLFLGTQLDNISDCVAKGRIGARYKGAANGSAKLTDTEVLRIREQLATGRKQADIAADFGVTQPLISMIALRKKWQHI